MREVKISLRTTNRQRALAMAASMWTMCVELRSDPASMKGRRLQAKEHAATFADGLGNICVGHALASGKFASFISSWW